MNFLSREKAAWPAEDRTDLSVKFVTFLISPFLSFLYSLRTPNRKSSFIVGFLFCVCFGMAFTADYVAEGESHMDGVDYRVWFEEYVYDSGVGYKAGLDDYLSFKGTTKDYYFDTVAFFLSRITDNYHVMFMVFAIIFAFFMYKSLRILTEDESFRNNLFCLLLLAIFCWNGIFNINGVRFWTAAWVGTYAMLQSFYKGKWQYLFLALITPFIHGSFWFFLIILTIALLTYRYRRVWSVLFFVSMAISNIAVDVFDMASDYIPSFLEYTVEAYTDEQGMEALSRKTESIAKITRIISRVYINLLVVMLIISDKSRATKNDKRLLGLLLVYMTIVNFFSLIPSLGARYMVVGMPLIALTWLRYYKGEVRNTWIYMFPVAFFMGIYTTIKYHYMVALDWSFYISSPFKMIFDYLVV